MQICIIMKMCEIDRRRCGEYNGNNENDNSISTFKGGYKKWLLFAARKKKGQGRVGFIYLSPQGKMNRNFGVFDASRFV